MRDWTHGVVAAPQADSRIRIFKRRQAALLLVWAVTGNAYSTPLSTQACDAGFQTVLAPWPEAPAEARALWLDRHSIRWPGSDASQRHVLYYSARGRISADVGSPVRGADGAIVLRPASALPPAATARLAPVEDGAPIGVLRVSIPGGISKETPVYAAETVPLGSLYARALDALTELSTGWLRNF